MRRRQWLGVAGGILAICAALAIRCSASRPRDDARIAAPASTAEPTTRAAHRDLRLQPRASIAGVVTDGAHAPLAHARVCAQPDGDDLPHALTRISRCAITDAHGAYVLADLFATDYAVTAMADHYLPGHLADIELHAGEARTGADVELLAGGVEIIGTVSDLGGGPIAHAQVYATNMTSTGSSVVVDTDDGGGFHLWVWPGSADVTAEADGYAPASMLGSAPGVFELELTPGGSLTGTVIDAHTGAPIAGASVAASTFSRRQEGELEPDDVTDDDGHFRVDRLRPGRYFALAIADHAYGLSDGSTLVGLGQHVADVVIRAYPAANVEGAISIAGTPPRPCPHPSLTLVRTRPEDDLDSHPVGGGAVRVDGVLPGSYDVQPRCAGYVLAVAPARLEVGDHDVTGLTWQFTTGGTIRGHVFGPDHAPVAGAVVNDEMNGTTRSTASDGSYELTGLTAGPHAIQVHSGAGTDAEQRATATLAAGATIVQDVTLAVGGSIDGLVIDTNGEPVAGIAFIAQLRAGDYLEVRSDSAGRFRFENLASGPYSISVTDPGSPHDMEHVSVAAGHATSMKVVLRARAGQITGSVVDSTGAPVTDAYVTASGETDGTIIDAAWAATATDGTFILRPLVSGTYRLSAARIGAGRATVDHVPVGGTARIQIKPTGSITGTVRGAPIDFTVELNGSRRERFYRTEGRFHVDDVPAGSYQLYATDGASSATTTVELADGTHVSVGDLTLAPLVSITGRVVDLISKQPLSGAWIHVDERVRHARVQTDSDGRFAIDYVSRGPISILVLPGPDYLDGRVQRVIDPAGTADLGDIPVVKRRFPAGRARGDLGFRFARDATRVDSIDARGPAATSGLAVGDLVTTIDGIDVTALDSLAANGLLLVPPGTAIQLGLARGATITLVAAAL